VAPNSLDEEAIFHAVRRIQSHSERADYLVQACGDNLSLRDRIAALIKNHDEQRPLAPCTWRSSNNRSAGGWP
jgi:hypothetical protein